MKNKPKILISACLLGENCKYNGGNNANAIPADALAKLRQNYELVAVCPECMGGLTTPREPAEICANGRVFTKFSGRDVTAEAQAAEAARSTTEALLRGSLAATA